MAVSKISAMSGRKNGRQRIKKPDTRHIIYVRATIPFDKRELMRSIEVGNGIDIFEPINRDIYRLPARTMPIRWINLFPIDGFVGKEKERKETKKKKGDAR